MRFMNLRGRVFAAAVFTLIAALPGAALAAGSLWSHNGSVMRWIADGQRRLMLYEQPRADLAAIGVGKGTIFFDGARAGTRISGHARVYRKNCPRAEYAVSGEITSELAFTLTGAAPIFAQNGCDTVGYDSRGQNSTLHFEYISK
jgi:hypothetical protein